MTISELVTAIEAELVRLDAGDICVYSDDDLPRGWVRVSDGTGETYGPADEIVAALRAIEYEYESEDNGWELAWEALTFADSAPESSQEWPSELIAYRQLEDGTCNDNPLTLIAVETNAGTRYTAGPHGVDCCALSDLLSNGGSLEETAEQALEA